MALSPNRILPAIVMASASFLTAAPPMLVIGLDGFRHDWLARPEAAPLRAIAARGARVKEMTPVFPSTTFPNFYSMATGLTPARHGLVGMMFVDGATGERFSYKKNTTEGKWYGGVPFWQLATEQGVRTGTFFWPGSDAGANGKYPDSYRKYDYRVTHEEKLQTVVDWVKQGYGLTVAYFSDVDSAGHAHGPDSEEVRAAMEKTCKTVEQLVAFALMARPDLNVLIVSDHGMSAVEKVVDLSGQADYAGCRAANEGPMTQLYCQDPERVYRALAGKSPDYRVWRKREIPAALRYRDSSRIGDLLIVPTGPYIVNVVIEGDGSEPVPPLKGMHGYDPATNREMKGLLIGLGPAFREGAVVDGARNEDVFAVVATVLGLKMPAGVDARLNRVRGLLR
jgi:alkaline phosphatase D